MLYVPVVGSAFENGGHDVVVLAEILNIVTHFWICISFDVFYY